MIHDDQNTAASGSPTGITGEERREFLARASKIAVAAPAMTLLLQAASKPAQAQSYVPPNSF